MFTLNLLPKTTTSPKKRRGQGYGSGKGGHTSGRGQKGQRSRGSIPLWFEGGQLPQIRRFPFIRGKRRFKSLSHGTIEVSLTVLNRLPKNSLVTPKTLADAGIIKARDLQSMQIKVLGYGQLTVPLIVSVHTSKNAAAKIIAAGGEIKNESSA
jgi:large subunit ribosomal protein L15